MANSQENVQLFGFRDWNKTLYFLFRFEWETVQLVFPPSEKSIVIICSFHVCLSVIEVPITSIIVSAFDGSFWGVVHE
jgi:hypothetical protein